MDFFTMLRNDGTMHRIASNIAIRRVVRRCAIGITNKESDRRGVISVTLTFQGRPMHSAEAAGLLLPVIARCGAVDVCLSILSRPL